MLIQKVEKGRFTASLQPVAKKVVQMFRSRQAVSILLITILQHKGTDKDTSSASEMNFQRIMVSLQNWKWLHNPPSYFHSTFEMPKWKTGDWLIFWSEDRAVGLSMGSNSGHLYSLSSVPWLGLWSHSIALVLKLYEHTHLQESNRTRSVSRWLVTRTDAIVRVWCWVIIMQHLFAKCWTILSPLSLTAVLEPLVLLKFHQTVEWKHRNLEGRS